MVENRQDTQCVTHIEFRSHLDGKTGFLDKLKAAKIVFDLARSVFYVAKG